MQLTGTQFTDTAAIFGNDLSTFPDFPAEIRAPIGTLAGVSGFQIHFGSVEINTPGDYCDVLVVMNAAALKANLRELKQGGIIIANTDGFDPKNLRLANIPADKNPLEDGSLSKYQLFTMDVTKITRTALMVTLHCARQVYDSAFRKGVDWMLESGGAEGSMIMRIANLFSPSPTGHNPKFRGWPWRPETTSWIEPTAHSLVALKQAVSQVPGALIKRRVVLAEGMILHRRCNDGGWNYGSRAALGIDLPSYPETTALALLGLQGNRAADIEPAIARAHAMYNETKSPLAKAWLAITLRNYGVALPTPEDGAPTGRDIQLAALECIGYPGGAHSLLKPAGIA